MNINRKLSQSHKRFVLNRDGWCCNHCGYVPFHNKKLISLQRGALALFEVKSFINSVTERPPYVIVKYDLIDNSEGTRLQCGFSYLHGGELEFDHIVPVINGGSLNLENVQALCSECHRRKSYIDYRGTPSFKTAFSKYGNMVSQLKGWGEA